MRRRIEIHPTTSVAFLTAILLSTAIASQDVPFDGVVTQQKVQVRSGAAPLYYVVGELKAGDRVRVDEVLFGWYKIEAPTNTFSYVSKGFVDAQGDGTLGIVSKDRTPVKAASVKGYGESYRRQVDLMKGDRVRIVDEEDSYFRIIPPKNTYVFLPPNSVRPATKSELASKAPSPESKSPESPTPAKQRVSDPVSEVTTQTEPQTAVGSDKPLPNLQRIHAETPATPDLTSTESESEPIPSPSDADAGESADAQTMASSNGKPAPEQVDESVEQRTVVDGPISESVKAAEERMVAALQEPLEQQPISELLATYQSVAKAPNLPLTDRRLVAARIAQLKRNRELVAVVKEIAKVRNEVTTPDADAQDPLLPAAPSTPQYSAVGQLFASTVYDGRYLPILYRLVEPEAMRTLMYIRPSSVIDPRLTLGRFVGIIGQSQYDAALNVRIITVEHIDVLEPATNSASASANPRPRIPRPGSN